MLYIKYVLSFIVLLALSGCNGENTRQENAAKAKVYLEQQLKSTLVSTGSMSDPFEAYLTLIRWSHGVDNDGNIIIYQNADKSVSISQYDFVVIGGETLDNRQEAITATYVYLESALEKGNKKAFLELYKTQDVIESDMYARLKMEQLRTQFSQAYASLVESLSVGNSLDDDLILFYADQLKRGEIYQKNTAKSIEYYQKLYPTNKVVAFYLIGVYLDVNDYENAYFWNIRCIDDCAAKYKETPIVAENLPDLFRAKLTSEQFKEIEDASNDPTRNNFK